MKALLIAATLLLAGGLTYYHFYYPPNVLKRETSAVLTTLNDAVATKDQNKILEAFRQAMTEDATIALEVNFFAIANKRPAMMQNFPDRESFISYLDNIIYSLNDYDFVAKLDSFELAEDQQSAKVTFSTKQWGDGNSYYGGVSILMRHSTNADCEGEVVFSDQNPQLKNAKCNMQLRSIARPGEVDKLRNLDSLQDLLKK